MSPEEFMAMYISSCVVSSLVSIIFRRSMKSPGISLGAVCVLYDLFIKKLFVENNMYVNFYHIFSLVLYYLLWDILHYHILMKNWVLYFYQLYNLMQFM